MARARNVKPSFFTSEQVAACSPLARLIFIGLWTICDRAGKLRDRPRKIKAELLPYEAEPDADVWLAELAKAGLVLRYEVDGERYLKVLEFVKHQNPHPKEPPSEIPEPRPAVVEPRKVTASHGEDAAGSAVSPFPFPPSPTPQPATAAVNGHGTAAIDEEEPSGDVPRADFRLVGLRTVLGERLGFDRMLGIGKQANAVVASFTRWVETVGEDALVQQCLELAAEHRERPSNLAWWQGWLDTVPTDRLRMLAAEKRGA